MPAARLFYFAISETDTQLEEGTEWKAAGVAVDRVTTIVDVRDYISTQTRAAAAYISMGKLGEPWPPEDLAIRQRANEGKDHFVMALSYPAGPPPSAGLFG